jgi:hypothetical protein
MRMRILVAILFSGFLSLTSLEGQQLKKTDTYPKPHHHLYFKTTPFISIDEKGSIYAIDNVGHAVYKIDLIGDKVIKFAGPGQGPGEVQWPTQNCLGYQTLFVKAEPSIHLFSLDGKYINRFKYTGIPISIGADSETIYLAETGSADLIQEYSYDGRKKGSFGSKYPINRKIYKGWGDSFLESNINAGKVIVGDKFIFFLSYPFSELFKYNRDGTLAERFVIEEDELTRKSRDAYFAKGQDMPSSRMFKYEEIVLDGCYFDGYLYLVRIYLDKDGQREVELLRIPEEGTHSVEKIFFEPTEGMNKGIRSICVGGRDKAHPKYYISQYDDKDEDFVIKIFERSKEQ